MEKFKNFVSKFHWLFKLAAIALLVVMIFAPTVSYLSHRTPFTSPWAFILHFLDLGEIPFNSQSSYVWFSCWAFVLISTLLAILLLVSIFCKKIFYGCLVLYFIDLIPFIICSVFLFQNAPAMPSIAFYAALVLLIADIATLVLMKKPQSKKDAKIAELEKRIEELENGKNGK